MSAGADWLYLRAGLLAVAVLAVAAVVGWGIQAATYDDPAFERLSTCLRREKHLALEPTSDPVARSADLGALHTVIETNGITVAVSSSKQRAARVAASYTSVAGDLGPRLEQRAGTVYLWDRPPSPTQQQTVYDCTS